MALHVGDKAPVFTLYDTDKKERSLTEFLGKKTVLAFYPGAFTGVCTKEMCAFRDMLAEFTGMDAQIAGISVDSPFSNKAFATANNLTFPLLCDFRREVIKIYDVVWHDLSGVKGYDCANRVVFVLDNGGTIRYRWVGDHPGQEPPYAEITNALATLS